MTQEPKPRCRSMDGEMLALAAIIGVLVAFNLLTATWFPQPWLDEMAYADPAIRFVLGKGFTSAAWPSQGSDAFWASNCPLHEILLIPWLKAFGINLVAVRALNVVLCAASIVFIWAATKRDGWVLGAGWRLFMCFMLVTGCAMTDVVRRGRPDGVTVIVAAALALQFARTRNSIGRSNWNWGPFLTAAAAPWAGLQLVVGIGAVCAFSAIVDRRNSWRYIAGVAGGVAAGFVLLLLFYGIHGQTITFLERTMGSAHTVTGKIAQYSVIHDELAREKLAAYLLESLLIFRAWIVDPSYVCVMLGILGCAIGCRIKSALDARSFVRFGLLAGLGTPVVVMLAGKYPPYYAWMGFSLAVVCTVAVACRLWVACGRATRFAIMAPLVAACLVGAPRLFAEAMLGGVVNYGQIERFVRGNVAPADRAFVEGAAYFATTSYAAETYCLDYGGGRGFKEIPQQQRDSVTVLILAPRSLEVALRKLGGRWKAMARLPVPATPYDDERELTVYRRDSASAAQ